jgi:uncharacterized protein YkwD
MFKSTSPTAPRIAVLVVTLTLMLSVLSAGWPTTSASASPAVAAAPAVSVSEAEQQFLAMLNQTRSGEGLAPLSLNGSLSTQGRAWSEEMRRTNQLAHDPNTAAETSQVVPDWQRVGENVGVGYSVSTLHQAFWDSPGHRANMLGSFNQVGVGVVIEGNGKIWVTFRFVLGSLTDSSPPTAIINPPLPQTSSSARLSVGWWGQDDRSGIRRFDVQVTDNGAPWVSWFDGTSPKYRAGQDASGEFNFYGRAGHSYRFRVRATDAAGNVSGWSESGTVAIASNASSPTPFGQMQAISRTGDLSALSSSPLGGPQWSNDVVRGFAARPGGGGYVLDDFGGVYAVGGAPALPNSSYWPGWDIARGLALNPDGSGGYVLDGWGGLHPFGGAAPVAPSGYWYGWDIARGITLLPTSTASAPAGYVMDAWGGLHPFGGAPRVYDSPYWVGWAMARAVVANPTGPGGWTLDGWGGVHAWGGAPTLPSTAYWFGQDVARGLAVYSTPSGLAGYLLDWWGGVHAIGSAPGVESTRYWQGSDTARFLAVST